MRIQGIQKLTLLDFPGKVACTVFTVGCNLRCPFCHNAPLVENGIGDMSADEVIEFLKKRVGILDGVCITGGEPLIHADIADFLRDIHATGYAIKLDTNGTFPVRLKTLLDERLVDYVAMDIKASEQNYRKLCGVDVNTESIKKSISLLKESGIPHEFRTTAVGNLHTTDDFVKIARHIGDEAYFIQCFTDSGNILSDGCEPFSKEELQAILSEVRQYTPKAELRGI